VAEGYRQSRHWPNNRPVSSNDGIAIGFRVDDVEAASTELAAFNAARAELGLPALAHLSDQHHAAARVLVLTSRAFDFPPPSHPT
jgi:hypothetical protein